MEPWVLVCTICCLVCATIYAQEWLRNGKSSVRREWFQLGYGGGRVSIGAQKKTRYLKYVKKLRKILCKVDEDRVSMQISEVYANQQCELLSSECRRLVEPSQPDFIFQESYCTLRRALNLMRDCCTGSWLTNAVQFGNCQEHFREILLDLHRLPILVNLIGFRGESLDTMHESLQSTNICPEVERMMFAAAEFDGNALRSRKVSHAAPDYFLADQLTEKSPLLVPPEIGSLVTNFDFLSTPCIYRGSGNIFVFPGKVCSRDFMIKMRCSKPGATVEDHQDSTLQTEAKFMKKCRHLYAVGLLGYWEVTRTDGPKVPLLVMESMERNLRQIIEEKKKNIKRWWWWGGTGGFPALDAINLVLPVAKVMRHLHRLGVVHRDLKPQNILFTRVSQTQHLPEDISVKLADFGDAEEVRGSGEVYKRGTPGYMDPDVRRKARPSISAKLIFSVLAWFLENS